MNTDKLYATNFERILNEYALGEFVASEALAGGAANIFKLQTTQGVFVVKDAGNEAELTFYREVEERLNAAGVRQARLFTAKSGQLHASNGQAVFEFLSGQWLHRPTPSQTQAFMRYFAAYNRALRPIKVPAFVHKIDNPRKKADSFDYLLQEFPAVLAKFKLGALFEEIAPRALNFLAENRALLESLPKQLVHGDAGPGNILFDGDKVVALIDFTPYYETPLYSLAVSFYWQYGYFNNCVLNLDRIKADFSEYAKYYLLSEADKAYFYHSFVKVASRILFVSLLLHTDWNWPFPLEECEKNAAVMQSIFDNRRVIENLL